MEADAGDDALLVGLSARSLESRLVRCVPHLAYARGTPPSFLFSSRNAGRCNPAGVECLYFSEDEKTANAEYLRPLKELSTEYQPKLTFYAQVKLAGVVDLGEPGNVSRLSLTKADFFGPWLRRDLTPLQRLGRAISAQHRISAVRFPSAGAKAEGLVGWNVAIYRRSVVRPDRVEILGEGRDPIEVLPQA